MGLEEFGQRKGRCKNLPFILYVCFGRFQAFVRSEKLFRLSVRLRNNRALEQLYNPKYTLAPVFSRSHDSTFGEWDRSAR